MIRLKGMKALKRPLRLTGFALLAVISPFTTASASDRVQVCDDVVPWPPYTYPAVESDEVGSLGQTGAMVEFLDAVMRLADLRYQLKLRPWNRCLHELTRHGLPDQSEIAINASFSAERAKLYHYSDVIYRTTRGIFYSQNVFPDGPEINTLGDLKKFKICGVKGYNYQDAGLSNEDLSATASSLPLALRMLSKGRCQVLVNSVEPIMGTKLFGTSIVPPGVTYKATSLGSAPTTFHFIVSRGNPRGAALSQRLNDAIKTLIENGTRDEIFQRYRRLMDE